jgi:hypothetical protein
MDTLEQYKEFHKNTSHDWLVEDMWKRDQEVIKLKSAIAWQKMRTKEIERFADEQLAKLAKAQTEDITLILVDEDRIKDVCAALAWHKECPDILESTECDFSYEALKILWYKFLTEDAKRWG